KPSWSTAEAGRTGPRIGCRACGIYERVRRGPRRFRRAFARLPGTSALGRVAQTAFVKDAPQIHRNAGEKLAGRPSGLDPRIHIADAPIVGGDRVWPIPVMPKQL